MCYETHQPSSAKFFLNSLLHLVLYITFLYFPKGINSGVGYKSRADINLNFCLNQKCVTYKAIL